MKTLTAVCQLACVICLTLCLSTSVVAADEKEYRTSPGGTGALTPKMIKNCIAMKKSLDEQAADAAITKEQLEEMDAEVKRVEDQLLADETTLDKSDADALAKHNGRVQAFQSLKEEYQVKTEEYNRQIEPYSGLAKKYKKLCDNQAYYQDDYEQAKQEMGYGLE